jgi:hypothetical protein
LVRFGARDYSSETGQSTARDPLLFAGAQYSLYAYVDNHPINFLDPLGTGPRGPPHYTHVIPEAEHETLEYIWEVTKTFLGAGGAHLLEHTQLLPPAVAFHTATAVVEAADEGGQVIGVVADVVTGGQLSSAANQAKQIGNPQEPASKAQPFNPFGS